MLREESYEPILNSVGACRWKMVCQGVQALPQDAGPVVILHPYPPIVQVNDHPLLRGSAMTKVMDQGICFIRKRPPERSAALRGGSGKCLRKAAVLIFRDSGGPRQQGVQFRKPISIFIYKGGMTPLLHYLIQHGHGVHPSFAHCIVMPSICSTGSSSYSSYRQKPRAPISSLRISSVL